MNVLHCTPGQSINHYIGGGSFLLSSCLVNSLLSLQSLNLVLQYLRYHVETYAIEMLCTVKDYTFMAPEMRKPLKQFLLVGLAINLVRPFKIFIFTKMYVRLSKFILEFFFPSLIQECGLNLGSMTHGFHVNVYYAFQQTPLLKLKQL